jgi:hypothetical protein
MKQVLRKTMALVCFSGIPLAQKGACQCDRRIDSTKYRTYHWITIAGHSAPNQISAQNIVNLINSAQKGLAPAVTGTRSDLYVLYQGSLDQQKQVNLAKRRRSMDRGVRLSPASTRTIGVGRWRLTLCNPPRNS